MSERPVATDSAAVEMFFEINGQSIDVGITCTSFRFKAMMNGGYTISGRLKDANFNILKKLVVDTEYFELARSNVFICRFRLKWVNGDGQQQFQTAHIITLNASGRDADSADFEFTGIDPPSWYLNTGDASGRVFKGRMCDVVRQVINQYAPRISVEVSETTDSPQMRYWMMGQDPKTFLASLIDWSSSITRNRTQWVVSMDDTYLQIKEQADMVSRNVAFYVGPHCGGDSPTIREWQLIANNALSISNTKLITHGISSVSGQYLDRITSSDKVTVTDTNTQNKYKAKIGGDRGFAKPPDGSPPSVGFTRISSVPEMYSAGEIGLKYGDYIDGRARGMWLNMANIVTRCRFRVIGHGVFYSCIGLGADTITIQWLDVNGNQFFLSGNWIVYGFEQIYWNNNWVTDVYAARQDYDAAAKPVPSVAS